MSSSQSSAGERLEQDRRRVQLAAAPTGPQLEQLRPGDAEQEDRCVARPVGDVLDQVEEDRLGPLDVVEDDDLRPLRRPRLDQLAKRELRLCGRAADHLAGVDADRDQDLDERPVGDVLAVVEAAAAENVGATPTAARNSSVSRLPAHRLYVSDNFGFINRSNAIRFFIREQESSRPSQMTEPSL